MIPNVSINFGQERTRSNWSPKPIPLTPGFTRTTLAHARRVHLDRQGGRADTRHLWPAINRKTGATDCVIGPCTFDEMIETWTLLEGGKQPEAEYRWVQRGGQ